MPKLYHFSLDPMSRRLRLALAEYGFGFELIEQKPWEPDPALYGVSVIGATMPLSALMRANWALVRIRSVRALSWTRSNGMTWLASTG